MKILMLDIERTPNIAYVWGLFKENIPLARLIDTSKLLCYAAKWYGDDEIFYDSVYQTKTKTFLKGLHKLLDEADVVVHYNGAAFDIPVINTAFVESNIKPPAPYKQVDLLKVVRQQFKFTSNKMDHVSQQLGLGAKNDTNFELWVGCINNDPESWQTMQEYNIEDVMILERMYETLKPWIKGHPNQSVFEDAQVCPTCGGNHIQKRGFSLSSAARYQRMHCQDCGSWFRSSKMEERDVETFRAI